MRTGRLLFIPLALLASACASTGMQTAGDTAPATAPASPEYQEVANPRFAAIRDADTKAERDRLAILAMQGEYVVDFHFAETVPLAAGYERRDDKDSGGFEVVFVVEDGDQRIVLQHLLVMPGGHVIKHWRQDWVYEADERFEFVADQTWQVRAIEPDKTAGAWTQCVYEVSDAPRYCGTGQWNHRYGVSTWTSDRSWRPLPRREYTKRDDYNALNAENRHTITPHGWTHEQDNTKTVRDGRETAATLVREFGFNDYRSIAGFDFEPAREYWQRTGDYWARVREAWDRRLASGTTLVLTTEIDGMPIIQGTFAQAAKADEMSVDEQVDAIEDLLAKWTSSDSDATLAAN
ncbi:DUF6607 family protein [Lentisalinibacter sediminis]|uniref:DUF6607 family protein n=1 Tax=Lentisalinibacter sediminis TaxID=2992237 RepID=UPI003868F1CA